MTVNNFDKLSSEFDKLLNKEDFYFIQIIARKKDRNNKRDESIKSYYIYNKEQYFEYKESIIKLCKDNNARAYFWINPRNSRIVSLECIKLYTDFLIQNDCSKGFKIWDKACGITRAKNYDKLWIVDIDTKNVNYINKIINIINNTAGKTLNKVENIIDTLQGVHLITTPFDLHHFKQLCIINHINDNIDIHKNNCTLLYYENNEIN